MPELAAGGGLVIIPTIHPEHSSLQRAVTSDTESTQKAGRVGTGIPIPQMTGLRGLGLGVRPEAAEAAEAPPPGPLTPPWSGLRPGRQVAVLLLSEPTPR